MKNYDSDLLLQAKQAVLNGTPLPKACLEAVDQRIVHSWRVSRAYGVNACATGLPRESIDFSAKSRLTDYKLYALRRGEPFYNAKHAFLASMGVALLYLDDQLCVINKGGCPHLLQELKGKGVKFGTSFSQKRIGTTGVSLLKEDAPLRPVIGEEHFVAALTPYVSVAFYATNKNTTMIQVVFFRLDQCSQPLMILSELLYHMEAYHTETLHLEYGRIRDKVVELSLQNGQSFLLLVDAEGVILDVNHALSEFFHISTEELAGRPLKVLFPDLKDALIVLETMQPLSEPVTIQDFPRDRREYSMRCTPVIQGELCIGMVIQLEKLQPAEDGSGKDLDTRPLLGTSYSFSDLIGKNQAFAALKSKAMIAAQSPSNIMLCGETGTGKELFAHAIHEASPWRSGPFVAINCGAIPPQLIGSELFGYEEGAFTGAKKAGAPGKFELAHNGTLFLDEIAEMPVDIQSTLLRVLEDGRVTRLGSSKSRPIRVRIIAATNRNLKDSIQKGKFRADLYYRLNVIRIDIIPLRERKDDIPLLAAHFLNTFFPSSSGSIHALPLKTQKRLQRYDWPGNLRELRNAIEFAVNVSQSHTILPEHLPQDIQDGSKPDDPAAAEVAGAASPSPLNNAPAANAVSLESFAECGDYEAYERETIRRLMFKYSGNKTLVAKEMNMARSTLYRKLKNLPR